MMAGGRDPRRRFSDRVEHYVRSRPGYPEEVVGLIRRDTGVEPPAVVADVGSGTGLFAELLLRHGYRVLGVEPNAEMRRAAEERLAGRDGFTSVAGAAEATGLETASVDLVAAAQAFHWFDLEPARRELTRVLAPPRWAALVWNTRRAGSTPFLRAYEGLLRRWGTDYLEVGHREVSREALGAFFAGGRYRRHALDHEQRLDLDGLRARLLSSSYVPGPGHPDHEPMLRELEAIFTEHQDGGKVVIEYDTELFVGRLD